MSEVRKVESGRERPDLGLRSHKRLSRRRAIDLISLAMSWSRKAPSSAVIQLTQPPDNNTKLYIAPILQTGSF